MADEVTTETTETPTTTPVVEQPGSSWPVLGEPTQPLEQPKTDEAKPEGEKVEQPEPEITADTQPAEVLSSYQRLKAKSTEAENTAQQKIAELESKLADQESVPTFRIDKPSDEWNAKEELLDRLPEAHRDLVITAVLDNALAPIAQMVAQNPTEYADDYQMFTRALGPIAERCYERPLAEINEIMTVTQGISAQQIKAALGGTAPAFQPTGFQQPFNTNASPIYAAAQQAGLSLEDEGTAAFLQQVNGAFGELQKQTSMVTNETAALRKEVESLRQGQQGQSESQIKAGIDQSVAQSRQSALDLVIKDDKGQSRIPAGDTESLTTIKARAEYDLQSSALQQHLNAAVKWQKDGMKDAAGKSLRLAEGVIRNAYAAAAAAVLGQPTAKPTVTPAPRLVGGAQPAGSTAVSEIIKNAPRIGTNFSEAGKLAEQIARSMRSS